MAKRKSVTQMKREFMDAMFRFIQKHHPPEFPVVAFQVCGQCGRIDEMVEILNKFTKEKKDEATNNNAGRD